MTGNITLVELIAKAIRYLVAAVGGGTTVASDDVVLQVAGAIVIVGSFAWSVYRDWKKQ